MAVGDGVAWFFASFFVNIIRLIIHTFKVIFNIAFMARAFYLLIPKIPLFYQIKGTLAEAAQKIAPKTAAIREAFLSVLAVFDTADTFFNNLDLGYHWRQESECGGGVMWLQIVAVILLLGFVAVLSASDLMYIIAIRSRKLKQKASNKVVKYLIGGLLDGFTSSLFYLLQIFAFVGYELLLSGYNSGDNESVSVCSSRDSGALYAGKLFTWLIIAVGAITAFVTFSAFIETYKKHKNQGNILKVLILAAKHIFCLNLGIWDPETLQSYEVIEKAAKYDDDPTDKDSQQEAVISIISKTRGIFWIFIPATVFLTKICETMNESIIFGRLEYSDPFYKRLIKWILNLIDVSQMIILVFVPDVRAAMALFSSIIIRFVFETIDGWLHAFKLMSPYINKVLRGAQDVLEMKDLVDEKVDVALDKMGDAAPGSDLVVGVVVETAEDKIKDKIEEKVEDSIAEKFEEKFGTKMEAGTANQDTQAVNDNEDIQNENTKQEDAKRSLEISNEQRRSVIVDSSAQQRRSVIVDDSAQQQRRSVIIDDPTQQQRRSVVIDNSNQRRSVIIDNSDQQRRSIVDDSDQGSVVSHSSDHPMTVPHDLAENSSEED